MLDLRPVGYVIGLLVLALGVTMLLPLALEIHDARGAWPPFLEGAIFTMMCGGMMALACANGVHDKLSLQQTFMITTGVWVALPFFGAIPFALGATEARAVDAFFEAMSGLTTTGATVFSGLDDLPRGLLLWRGIMQWLGGVGIIVFAMVFLPELRVGGMQIFRAEGFETMGKILPRATEIARQISVIYVAITAACFFSYLAVGMGWFDALVHAFTTVATGGFSNYDASFAAFSGGAEYIATAFMILSALPFVRYVQILNGSAEPLLQDTQVRSFLLLIAALVVITAAILSTLSAHPWEQAFREALFNITSITSGTGYASVDYMQWGTFLIAMFFFIGLIGGCAGSTTCSIKIFRYQLLFGAVRTELKRIHSPHGVFANKYEGRTVTPDIMNSVMSFFVFFIVTLGIFSVALGITGLDFVTSVSGASAALANIGPGLGEIIGPAGNYAALNDAAKWLLALAMLIGRLELMAVFVLFTAQFWRG
ncbi:TrkH family potassium uptake protein [Poseidonocella sedimentorum]|uniref:Trk system potassium uptake protein n=1 Tax=Poseidonocella sedimentorum TaxID=871652 RepID=A0A1I6DYQ0_9RHOB|nr:TrkH family potassium uptake protein [Poseidonocella sedimentorum]SFR10546.1 trk system potassium uptake protein TrkH [Poseidonocella sedimentorum]